jgi:hypothetical protein
VAGLFSVAREGRGRCGRGQTKKLWVRAIAINTLWMARFSPKPGVRSHEISAAKRPFPVYATLTPMFRIHYGDSVAN